MRGTGNAETVCNTSFHVFLSLSHDFDILNGFLKVPSAVWPLNHAGRIQESVRNFKEKAATFKMAAVPEQQGYKEM